MLHYIMLYYLTLHRCDRPQPPRLGAGAIPATGAEDGLPSGGRQGKPLVQRRFLQKWRIMRRIMMVLDTAKDT